MDDKHNTFRVLPPPFGAGGDADAAHIILTTAKEQVGYLLCISTVRHDHTLTYTLQHNTQLRIHWQL
jgi:hypothetical protein